MTPLSEMSLGHRVALTVAICIIILIVLALFGYLTGAWDEGNDTSFSLAGTSHAQEAELCVPDEETRERIRVIMIEAIDDALKDHIKHMFEVWMKDDRGQPGRAAVGTRQGLKAHQGARKAVLTWNPPTCAG